MKTYPAFFKTQYFETNIIQNVPLYTSLYLQACLKAVSYFSMKMSRTKRKKCTELAGTIIAQVLCATTELKIYN